MLSFIGGLRSFDLIWTMTRGGPGFTSDVIASVIYKQYQAGFYGLSTAGNVILFLLVTAIVFPCSGSSPARRSTCEHKRHLGWAYSDRPFGVVFLVPFAFILFTAAKTKTEASELQFSLPPSWRFSQNFRDALAARDYMLIIAFINSTVLTVVSVTILVVCRPWWPTSCSADRAAGTAWSTYWCSRADHPARGRADDLGHADARALQDPPRSHLRRDRVRAVLLILLFRAFIPTIPRDLDEAAIIDGAGPLRLFFRVIFPLLRAVIVTMIIVQSVSIFNDFDNPLYFLPGDENATVQLTVFNFQSQFNTQYNLLFANILLITIPPLIMFIFFNSAIVEGMTAGAVKG